MQRCSLSSPDTAAQFIFKTSEKSPLGALAMGNLVVQAGFPPGVINFVSGGGKTGQVLSAHMEIRKISFTGSAATGRQVQQAAARSNLKRVTLELGDQSPSLIFNDADIENAVTQEAHISSKHPQNLFEAVCGFITLFKTQSTSNTSIC